MELNEEVKQRYLDFCGYGERTYVYVDKKGNVCVNIIFEYGNGMGINEYNTFSLGERAENKVLCRVISKTESKWEYDENGGESPNNGEWEAERETIEYKVPEDFDLYNPDFSQVEKLKKSKGRK